MRLAKSAPNYPNSYVSQGWGTVDDTSKKPLMEPPLPTNRISLIVVGVFDQRPPPPLGMLKRKTVRGAPVMILSPFSIGASSLHGTRAYPEYDAPCGIPHTPLPSVLLSEATSMEDRERVEAQSCKTTTNNQKGNKQKRRST